MATIDIAKIRYVLEFQGKDAEAGMKRVGNAFNALRKIVTTVIAGKFVKDASRFGKEISVLSNRTGMSVQRLSRLRNAFISAGAGANGFESTIEKINHGLLALGRGETEWATKLYPMGISPWGKTADEIMYEMSDWAKNAIATGTSKEQVLDYLTSVMGIPAEKAETMLAGREAMLAEEARLRDKVGEVTEENKNNLVALNKALNDLNAAWENAKANVIGFMGPFLTKIIDGITYIVQLLGEHEWAGSIVAIGAALLSFGGGLSLVSKVLSGLGAIKFGALAKGLALVKFGLVALAAAAVGHMLGSLAGNLVAAGHRFLFGSAADDKKLMDKFVTDGKLNVQALKDREQEILSMSPSERDKHRKELSKISGWIDAVDPGYHGSLASENLARTEMLFDPKDAIVEDLDGAYGDNSTRVINADIHIDNVNGNPEEIEQAVKDGVLGALTPVVPAM